MSDIKTIVVIGATGHFGGRICLRIANEPNIRLIVAGRNQSKLNKLVTELQNSGKSRNIVAAAIDQFSSTLEADLKALHPFLIIHTAGPYQGQEYRVAEACIALGAHYLDLADGRRFVDGFTDLDDQAKNAEVLLVTGASTLPGLSSAVIDSVADQFKSIQSIEISIAPAHQTPRGPGTIAAVMSYCGKPFEVLEQGQWKTQHGWQNLRLQTYPHLAKRISAACDVPDLSLLPKYVKGVETVTFHAALEAWWEQIGLWLMAGLSRVGLIRSWKEFIPVFHSISKRLINLGSDEGGMHMRLSGTGVGNSPLVITWYLTAKSNHGPEIPCTPALVLARKLIRNQTDTRGAFACLGLMSLEDFKEELSGFDINWEIQTGDSL